jgi:hypothetical protein
MVTKFNTSAIPSTSTSGGSSIKTLLIVLSIVGISYVAWKNKDKIKAMFSKKTEPKK